MIRDFFNKNQTDKVKYSRFYDLWFSTRKFSTILEIGAYKGGGMRSYQQYYPNARVFGVDSDQLFADHSPDLDIMIGNQSDTAFLDRVLENIKSKSGNMPDLIIDDGGHTMSQQITSFQHLFWHLQPGGYYIIEDLETSYLKPWLDQDHTTVNFLKGLVDHVHFNGKTHNGENGVADLDGRNIPITPWERYIDSIHFANNICLVVKK